MGIDPTALIYHCKYDNFVVGGTEPELQFLRKHVLDFEIARFVELGVAVQQDVEITLAKNVGGGLEADFLVVLASIGGVNLEVAAGKDFAKAKRAVNVGGRRFVGEGA